MIDFYCIHHSEAIDRKEYIHNNFIHKFQINVNWIELFHPRSIEIQDHKKIHSIHSANKKYLNYAELSCFMKHRYAVALIAAGTNHGFIFEDDIESPSFNFNSAVDYFVDQMTIYNIDLLFVGSFTNHDLSPTTNYNIVCSDQTLSRCAHAYIVSNQCAKILYDYLLDIKAPFDWQLNYGINDLNLRSCWSYPHINQRTEKKQIKSLLR